MIEFSPQNIILLFLIIIIIYVFILFKVILNLKNISQNSWNELESQFRRKITLIFTLIDTLKYFKFDEKLLLDLNSKSQELSSVISTKDINQITKKEENLMITLNALNQNINSNQLLKQNSDIIKFKEILPQINLQISKLKECYNKNTDEYNTKIIGIPNFIIAKVFKFEEKELF